MRANRVLYGIAALALLAILAVFIAYATDNLPTHTPRQHDGHRLLRAASQGVSSHLVN